MTDTPAQTNLPEAALTAAFAVTAHELGIHISDLDPEEREHITNIVTAALEAMATIEATAAVAVEGQPPPRVAFEVEARNLTHAQEQATVTAAAYFGGRPHAVRVGTATPRVSLASGGSDTTVAVWDVACEGWTT